jgi:hypothetical protein
MAMPRMLAELEREPELGFLGGHYWFGRTIIVLQYWKSFGALTRYARQPDLAHLPAWAHFRQKLGDGGDVGIWHETYLIAEGQYETGAALEHSREGRKAVQFLRIGGCHWNPAQARFSGKTKI